MPDDARYARRFLIAAADGHRRLCAQNICAARAMRFRYDAARATRCDSVPAASRHFTRSPEIPDAAAEQRHAADCRR